MRQVDDAVQHQDRAPAAGASQMQLRPGHLDDRLARESARHSPHLLRGPWPGGDLDDPRSVAQVDENDPAQIPPTVYPATQPHALADVLQAQLAAAVRTSGCGADAVYGTSASHNTR